MEYALLHISADLGAERLLQRAESACDCNQPITS